MYKYSSLNNSPEEIKTESNLLQLVFANKKFSTEYLNWQYNENPDGKAVGFNAYSENGELAAHYVTQPMNAILFGKSAKGLLSLNTATHPNHQGKGLFTELAKKTYKLARELGYEFVIGVANQNSTHGFINKLGFQLVGQLKALVSFGSVCRFYPNENDFSKFDFFRKWNKNSLAWRISNPENNYFVNHSKIICDSGKPMIKAVIGCFEKSLLPQDTQNNIRKPLSLAIGTDSAVKSSLLNIPNFLRPSPLNLIFKDLTGKNKNISFDKTFFSAIDFDAY